MYFEQVHPLYYNPLTPHSLSAPQLFKQYLMGFIMLPSYIIYRYLFYHLILLYYILCIIMINYVYIYNETYLKTGSITITFISLHHHHFSLDSSYE
jgi:hypothetical protein